MPYFEDNYSQLSYPQATENESGLYRAQIGAIHALASHFTLADQPSIITMPTGSGKTAVLMMAPYVLKSLRVLVITPGRMVREQIAEDFDGLETLKKAGVLPIDCPTPKVIEVKSKLSTQTQWEALKPFDVVVSTPNCVSPGHKGVSAPPAGLFDLILIDEAHHSTAKTWAQLLDSLPESRRILFTATPFRKDRDEIIGKFTYTYPVAKAFEDKIFGRIKYVPAVPTSDQESEDEAIARTAATVLKHDREAGFNHRIMVRTDRLTRASELLALYEQKTDLKLELVQGQTSNNKVKEILGKLDDGTLDGVVCVNMLAEGFNFPRFKVAAIHRPHKSLEVTLQFIGRFARTNAPDIGEAKFIATQSELDIEGERLFVDGAVWQDIVENLSHGKIDEEERIRQGLEQFNQPEAVDEDLADLSLYSLHPRSHVKIFDVEGVDVNLNAEVEFPSKFDVRYRNTSEHADTVVVVIRHTHAPKWSATDQILDRHHMLLVIFHLKDQNLLFINSSNTIEGLYEAACAAVAPEARALSTGEVKRVVRNIKNQRVFNLGLRNLQATNTSESYLIIAASDAQVKPSDARKYVPGHVYLSGEEGAERVTIGYSAGSKVWGTAKDQIPLLLDWCRLLGQKIRTAGDVVTNTSLDSLAQGEIVHELPANIVVAQWNKRAFLLEDPVTIRYTGDDGKTHRGLLIDLELRIDRATSTADSLRIVATADSVSIEMDFSLSEAAADFFVMPNGDGARITVIHGSAEDGLSDFLNLYAPSLYTADGAMLVGNELNKPIENAIPIDLIQLDTTFDWSETDIESEVKATAKGQAIHTSISEALKGGDADIVVCDHGSGEIADFLSIKRVDDFVYLTLHHCKASEKPKPGARVGDVYEVCGQAQKSIVWRSIARIERRLTSRLEKLEYVRGDEATLKRLLTEAKNLRTTFTIVVVQPGISKEKLSTALAENLGATNDHVLSAGFRPLQLMVSK